MELRIRSSVSPGPRCGKSLKPKQAITSTRLFDFGECEQPQGPRARRIPPPCGRSVAGTVRRTINEKSGRRFSRFSIILVSIFLAAYPRPLLLPKPRPKLVAEVVPRDVAHHPTPRVRVANELPSDLGEHGRRRLVVLHGTLRSEVAVLQVDWPRYVIHTEAAAAAPAAVPRAASFAATPDAVQLVVGSERHQIHLLKRRVRVGKEDVRREVDRVLLEQECPLSIRLPEHAGEDVRLRVCADGVSQGLFERRARETEEHRGAGIGRRRVVVLKSAQQRSDDEARR